MGGIVRTIRKSVGKVFKEVGKGVGAVPSKKEMEAKAKAQEEAIKAQQAVETVDAPGVDPGKVVYSGEGDMAPKKKKRKKTPTIATGSKGVIGGAPTEKTTLLGG